MQLYIQLVFEKKIHGKQSIFEQPVQFENPNPNLILGLWLFIMYN